MVIEGFTEGSQRVPSVIFSQRGDFPGWYQQDTVTLVSLDQASERVKHTGNSYGECHVFKSLHVVTLASAGPSVNVTASAQAER